MNTECKPEQLEFQSLGRREVIGRFDGGRITSDGGGFLKRVFGLVIDFGTSQSPKSTRPLTTYWCPSHPGHQALRNNFASSLLLRTWLPNDWTPRSEAYFVFPLAQGTPGKQCGLAGTGVYQPSLRSPWLAARVIWFH